MNSRISHLEPYKIAFPEMYKLALENDYLIDNFHGKYVDDKPNWYPVEVPLDNFTEESDELHKDMILWLYKNIDNCERHCRWLRTYNGFLIKFRYERNYMWFKLRWS